jgi:hypothetical protein
LIDGDEAGVPGGDGEVDEARQDAGKPMASSMSSILSPGVCRARTEVSGRRYPPGHVEVIDLLRNKRGNKVREMLQVLGKGLGEGGGRGPSGKRRIRPGRLQERGVPSSDSAAARRKIQGEAKGEGGGGTGVFIG